MRWLIWFAVTTGVLVVLFLLLSMLAHVLGISFIEAGVIFLLASYVTDNTRVDISKGDE